MRNIVTALVLALLAACASVPAKPGFSKAQVAAMSEMGFEQVGEDYELGLEDRVLFEVDKSELGSEANALLARIGGTLIKVGIRGGDVVGHTDSTGSAEYNMQLSLRRASAIKAGLAGVGMDAARINDRGAGETQPVASNDTEEGRAQNRRVVIIISPDDAQ